VVFNSHAIIPYWTGDRPFSRFKPLETSLILSTLVHVKVFPRAYRAQSNTS
jgi:hypothetical protein